MNIDFELVLVCLTATSALIAIVGTLFFARGRSGGNVEGEGKQKQPVVVEYARSLFPIFLLVLLIRSFLIEPFRIPSESLEPTLLVGDYILVNKYDYGLRLPVLRNKLLSTGEPEEGDIVVFRWPPKESVYYIKRFVGMPGDHVKYANKVLYINGKQAKQKFLKYTTDGDGQGHTWKVEVRSENIQGTTHNIYIRPDIPAEDFEITVPPGNYFAMGDNRDNSGDSRIWGFVPEKNLVGKALTIFMSWNGSTDSVRWNRIGHPIN